MVIFFSCFPNRTSDKMKAAIVRIMKMRKTLHYNQLIEEIITMSESRFKPHISAIKKCIEDLIDKAYIQRQENDRAVLSYIA
eukprot:m.70507 g.70507  ORF g.70507 m.70507 type:complete len:82 (-) comp13778_c0_seq2:222-467(-)